MRGWRGILGLGSDIPQPLNQARRTIQPPRPTLVQAFAVPCVVSYTAKYEAHGHDKSPFSMRRWAMVFRSPHQQCGGAPMIMMSWQIRPGTSKTLFSKWGQTIVTTVFSVQSWTENVVSV